MILTRPSPPFRSESRIVAGVVEQLTIEADLVELERSSLWAAEVAERLALPASVRFAVDLCFEEAISNAIKFALTEVEPSARRVQLEMTREADVLRVTIAYPGLVFDPINMPEPAMPESLAEAKVGGLGIHLMRQFTSAIAYENSAGMNRLMLDFALN